MVARVGLGSLGSGRYGLKVSRDGVDVFSAADGDLLFDDLTGLSRVLAQGTIPFTYATAGSITIPFAQCSAVPAFMISMLQVRGGVKYSRRDAAGRAINNIAYNATSSQLSISWDASVCTDTPYVKAMWGMGYIIFADKAL